ncbi:hypothetical protein GCM10027605_29300 [Micromonospora zhanjiangensis]
MVPAADGDGGHRRVDRAGHHHAERDLPVVGGVGGVRGAGAVVEPDLAVHLGAQVCGEGREVDVVGGFGRAQDRVGQQLGHERSSLILSRATVARVATLCG